MYGQYFSPYVAVMHSILKLLLRMFCEQVFIDYAMFTCRMCLLLLNCSARSFVVMSCKCDIPENTVSSPSSKFGKKQTGSSGSRTLSSVAALHSCNHGICNWRIFGSNLSSSCVLYQELRCCILLICICYNCDRCYRCARADHCFLYCYQGNHQSSNDVICCFSISPQHSSTIS